VLMSGRHASWCLSAWNGRVVSLSRLCCLISLAVSVSPASPTPSPTPKATATPTATPAATKKIIHWQAGTAGHNTLPSHILNNLAWIDSLPFDGLVCYWDVTYELLAPGNVASYSNIYNTWFAPIKGKLKHVTHNYVTVFVRG